MGKLGTQCFTVAGRRDKSRLGKGGCREAAGRRGCLLTECRSECSSLDLEGWVTSGCQEQGTF